MAVFTRALSDFHVTTSDLELKLASAQARLEADFQAVDDCVQAHAAQSDAYGRLKRMFEQLKAEQLSGAGAGAGAGGAGAAGAADAGAGAAQQSREIAECGVKLTRAKLSLEKLKDAKSKTGSVYLRLMMGRVNVKLWKKSERLAFKDEYEKFKHRTTLLFILFPLLQLYSAHAQWHAQWSRFLFTIHQLWVIYMYGSLALRENILLVNGSTIMSWWIFHHYVSMAISTLMLTLQVDTPGGISSSQLQDKLQWFFWFCVAQGVVMCVSNWYQAKRSYARRTLGKAKALDVHSTETIVEKPTDLKLLVPLLFGLYVAELVLGADLCVFWHAKARDSLPLLACGALMCVLGVGNTVSTASVLLEKQQLRNFNRQNRERGEPLGTAKPSPVASPAIGATAATAAIVTPASLAAHNKPDSKLN